MLDGRFLIGWYPVPIAPETRDIVAEVLCSFTKFFQMNTRMQCPSDHLRFLPHTFQLIIHKSAYFRRYVIWDTEWIVRQRTVTTTIIILCNIFTIVSYNTYDPIRIRACDQQERSTPDCQINNVLFLDCKFTLQLRKCNINTRFVKLGMCAVGKWDERTWPISDN